MGERGKVQAMTLEGAVAIDVNDLWVKSIRQRAAEAGKPSENDVERKLTLKEAAEAATAMKKSETFKEAELIPFTIFRVPPYIREEKADYFDPKVVSIGPIHRDKDHLRRMEEQKWRYLHDLLSRSDVGLESFVEEMKALELLIRRCYGETFPNLSSNGFVEMLLLDASFILGVVFKCAGDFSRVQKSPEYNDLLMFENQIPFFVLECLFEHLVRSDGTTPPSTSTLVDLVYRTMCTNKKKSPPSVKDLKICHFLHLLYYLSAPEPPKPSTAPPDDKSAGQRLTIPCAVELQEAGVRFRKKRSDDLLDLGFSKSGVLDIPPLRIGKSTKTRYINFVVFEHCYKQGEVFTSYALFMDCIINTKRDVAILQQCGIVENLLPSEEDAANFFNDLAECAYGNYDKHPLDGLFRNVNRYCDSKWNSHWARFKRDYFSNPWAFISLLAAVFLLILTVIQTFLAVYPFLYTPSSGPSIL